MMNKAHKKRHLAQEDGDWPIDHRMPYAYGNVNDAYDNYGHDKNIGGLS
jgi:hypothetical protein